MSPAGFLARSRCRRGRTRDLCRRLHRSLHVLGVVLRVRRSGRCFGRRYIPQWVRFPAEIRSGCCRRSRGCRRCDIVALLVSAARASLKAFNPLQVGPISVNVPINGYRWPEEFGAWMKANLPADSAVFVTDWPGALAYYSDRRVVPMDGLVNDFGLDEELLEAGVQKYRCGHGSGRLRAAR